MATLSFNFDPDRFMDELKKDIQKSVENDLRNHPEKVLGDYIGKEISCECPECQNKEMTVINNSCVRCPKCGCIDHPNFVFDWGNIFE